MGSNLLDEIFQSLVSESSAEAMKKIIRTAKDAMSQNSTNTPRSFYNEAPSNLYEATSIQQTNSNAGNTNSKMDESKAPQADNSNIKKNRLTVPAKTQQTVNKKADEYSTIEDSSDLSINGLVNFMNNPDSDSLLTGVAFAEIFGPPKSKQRRNNHLWNSRY